MRGGVGQTGRQEGVNERKGKEGMRGEEFRKGM